MKLGNLERKEHTIHEGVGKLKGLCEIKKWSSKKPDKTGKRCCENGQVGEYERKRLVELFFYSNCSQI